MLLGRLSAAGVASVSPPRQIPAVVSVMGPHPRMLCRVDGRHLWRMLLPPCCCSGGCFAAVVVLAPLADALLPRLKLASSPLRFSLHYWQPMCCIPVLGLVGWGVKVEGPPLLLFVLCLWDLVGNLKITCESYVSPL